MDTPLAPLTKEAPPSPAKIFVIDALRAHCARRAGIFPEALPAEYAAVIDGLQITLTPTTWLVCEAGGPTNG